MDLLCINCHYNLRTRAAADACPECGEPIERTLSDGLLAVSYEQQRWLRTVWIGAAVVVVATLLQLLLGVGAFLVLEWAGLSSNVALAVWLDPLILIAAGGAFALTAPEPGSTALARRVRARLIARWLWVGSIVALHLVLPYVWPQYDVTDGLVVAFNLLWYSGGVAFAVALVAAGIYLRLQLQRIGRSVPWLLILAPAVVLLLLKVPFSVMPLSWNPNWVGWLYASLEVVYAGAVAVLFGMFAWRMRNAAVAGPRVESDEADEQDHGLPWVRIGIADPGATAEALAANDASPLQTADRRWLQSLWAGAGIAAAAHLPEGLATLGPEEWIAGGSGFLLLIIAAAGAFVMTRPEPGAERRSVKQSRLTARWLMTTMGLLALICLLVARRAGLHALYVMTESPPQADPSPAWLTVLPPLCMLALMAGAVALGVYMHLQLRRTGWYIHWVILASPGFLLMVAHFGPVVFWDLWPDWLFWSLVVLEPFWSAAVLGLFAFRVRQVAQAAAAGEIA